MTKQEIMQKNKNDNKEFDERQIKIIQNSYIMAGTVAICLSAVFIIIALFKGENLYALTAVVFVYVATMGMSLYKSTKKAAYIIMAIAGAIATIVFTVLFILS